jgi:jumonji domain-containing protein 7
MNENVQNLTVSIKEFLGNTVDIIDVPTPLEFYRNYVAQNKPCVIKNAATDWTCMENWKMDYLKEALSDGIFEIDVTPDGYADAVRKTELGEIFMQPEVKKMSFHEFLECRKGPNAHYFVSIYKEDNLSNSDYSNLHKDFESHKWAEYAFGYKHSAANIWFGDKRNIASVHSDNYENIYTVVTGEKHFIIFPPTDYYYLYPKNFQMGTYKTIDGKQVPILDEEQEEDQLWYSVDVQNPDSDRFPLFTNASPLYVTLKKGETLYLPSLWFHHVSQSEDQEGKAISVNFWYDMSFNSTFYLNQFMRDLKLQ